MITVEHVTKTYGAFTAVDAGIQIFTERLGQASFGGYVLTGDLAKTVRLGDQPRRCRTGHPPVGWGSTVRGRLVMTAPGALYVFRSMGSSTTTGPVSSATWPWTATASRTSPAGSPTGPNSTAF